VVIIGIAGASASGKSVLAKNVMDGFGADQVMMMSEDSYYKDQHNLSKDQRNLTNYDHPDAMDHDLMAQHLEALSMGQTIEQPVYSFHEHLRLSQTVLMKPCKVLLVEGILLFTQERLRSLFNLRIFMDVPLDVCLIRRLERDVNDRGRDLQSVLAQYQATVRPGYFNHISPSRGFADLIVPEGGENPAAIELLKARVAQMLI
jgi:uridine kinase|tara:strand:- start:1273 stop:1881 length:609 start_codon:yes stop_codon:yes gene_type:complete